MRVRYLFSSSLSELWEMLLDMLVSICLFSLSDRPSLEADIFHDLCWYPLLREYQNEQVLSLFWSQKRTISTSLLLYFAVIFSRIAFIFFSFLSFILYLSSFLSNFSPFSISVKKISPPPPVLATPFPSYIYIPPDRSHI
jgi:hypothetical protein